MSAELPEGWANAALFDICERLVDGSHNPPPVAELGKPMLSARNINDYQIIFDNFRLISDEDFESEHARTRISAGDVLLTIVGTIGRTAVVPEGLQPFALQRSVAVLKPRNVDSRYLSYVVSSPDLQTWLINNGKGTAQKGVYLKTLGMMTIPVAPAAEQTRIVEKLEELLSDLDAGVAELKAAQKKLAQYRQSLLKTAVEGALTAEWRAKNPPTETGAQLLERILRERRAHWETKQLAKFKEQGKTPPKDWQKKYPEPVQPDTSNLPKLPEGWVWATIDQLSMVVRGASPRPAGDPKYFGGDIPWITVGSITCDDEIYLVCTEQFVTEAGKEASRYIEIGTLLLTNSGATLGVPKISKIAGCINDGSVALFDVDTLTKLYLYWFLKTQTDRLRALNQGAAQPNLNTDIVRRIIVPLCPIAEQQKIIEVVEYAVSASKKQEESVIKSLKQSTAQRQNILRAAFSGQLVPQDPNDEPASVLLERIRNERQNTQKNQTERTRRRAVKDASQ